MISSTGRLILRYIHCHSNCNNNELPLLDVRMLHDGWPARGRRHLIDAGTLNTASPALFRTLCRKTFNFSIFPSLTYLIQSSFRQIPRRSFIHLVSTADLEKKQTCLGAILDATSCERFLACVNSVHCVGPEAKAASMRMEGAHIDVAESDVWAGSEA